MPPTNLGAYLPTAKAPSLSVEPAPYTPPSAHEILIRTGAVAINPVDWAVQTMGNDLFTLQYPFLGGNDVAGEIISVGSSVTRFKPSDRILGHALAFSDGSKGAAFQLYTILRENMASVIPESLSYEQAAVLPLGLSTASCGLYPKDYLALRYPTVDGAAKPTGKTVLVWGGSTSVGSCAVQLAVASGYEVVSTASPRNFEYVKGLGAKLVFDYNSDGVVGEIVEALKGTDFAGALAIGSAQAEGNGVQAAEACLEIVNRTEGRKFVAMALQVPEKVPEGVEAKFIFGSDLKDNEISHAIYGDFLPKALAEGKFVAKPEPLVVGKGLESIQAAFDAQRKGVSARKVVVSL